MGLFQPLTSICLPLATVSWFFATSLVIVEPAPTVAESPISIGATNIDPEPIKTLSFEQNQFNLILCLHFTVYYTENKHLFFSKTNEVIENKPKITTNINIIFSDFEAYIFSIIK